MSNPEPAKKATKSDATPAEDYRDGALLLQADITRNQAKSTALATGLPENYDAAEAAEANYQEVSNRVGEDLRTEAYAQLRNPGQLGSQSRQVDTSELTGFASAHAVAHAADVFGHPLQRTIATMAKLEADHEAELNK